MVRADHTFDRKISHRRVHVRHQMQTAWTEPGALDCYLGKIDRNQLADFRAAIDAGNQLQIDLRLGQRGARPLAVSRHEL